MTGTIDGFIPVSGTAIDQGGSLTLALSLIRSSELTYSVAWEFSLGPVTLDGPGYWRWFDSAAEGSFSATKVSCAVARPETAVPSMATGVR